MKSAVTFYQFSLGLVFGAVIACSPTKFNPTTNSNTLCDASVTNCVVEQGYIDLTQNFEVGAGKVDILFVDDNSASMSPIHVKLRDRFSGFIQNLDSRKIDYRIAVTTTDLEAVKTKKLVTLDNGQSFLTNQDANRAGLFNSAIIRSETLQCETFIVAMFNSYGTTFQSQASYASQYPQKCPSSDTRGLYTANLVVSENTNSFIRADANLNIILISNDEVRQGKQTLEANDKAETLSATIQQAYPNKYWNFNSIIVKDQNCQQQQTLKNAQGVTVSNQYGPAIAGGIGYEYAKVSNSAAKDIDNNPRPRGKILDICQNDYAQHFSDMATQISEASRMITLKCVPSQAPVVTVVGGGSAPYTWNGDKITFQKGSEGKQVSVQYKCYTGPK